MRSRDIFFLAGPMVDTSFIFFIFPFFYVGILKTYPQLCDGRWPMADSMAEVRRRTPDVRRHPEPWQVDAIKNHGGAIGSLLAR